MKTLEQTPLSILDLVSYTPDRPIAAAFQATKELAQHAESWGYKRYWMAEHHNLEGIASAATSVLIGFVASQTKTIRVGSGGIMLPNHAPLVIAEQFGTLETLYPGRIDLGLGRAPGTDQVTMRALRKDNALHGADFGDLIEELSFYFAPAEPGQRIQAIPGAGLQLPLYILGSSLYSAQLAARLGRPYAFAGHFAPADMLEAFELYRHQFQPSTVLDRPYVMVGVPVVAAATDAQADYLATSIYQRFLRLIRGQGPRAAKPVETMDGIWTPAEEAAVRSMLKMLIVGGTNKLKFQLQELINLTQADELIVTTDLYQQTDRLESYRLLASAAGKVPK